MVDLLRQTLPEAEYAPHTPTKPAFYRRSSFGVIIFIVLLAYMTYSYVHISLELFSTTNELEAVLDALSKVAVYDSGSREANEALTNLLPMGSSRRRLFLKLVKDATAKRAETEKLVKMGQRLATHFKRAWTF